MLDRGAKRRHIRYTTNPSRRIQFRFHIDRVRDLSYNLVTAASLQTETHVVVVAVADDGRSLDQEQSRRLLSLPVACAPVDSSRAPPALLSQALEQALHVVLDDVARRNMGWYDEEVAKLETWADEPLPVARCSTRRI